MCHTLAKIFVDPKSSHDLIYQAVVTEESFNVDLTTPASIGLQEADLTPEEMHTFELALKRIHVNVSHPSSLELVRAFRDAGYPPWVIERAKNFRCDACSSITRPRAGRPARIRFPTEFNDTVQIDQGSWKNPFNNTLETWISFVCRASGYHVAVPYTQPSAAAFWKKFVKHWVTPFGKPTVIELDPGGEGMSELVYRRASELGVRLEPCPAEAHWQIGSVEVSHKLLRRQLFLLSNSLSSSDYSFSELLGYALSAKNALSKQRGRRPVEWVLGKVPRYLAEAPAAENLSEQVGDSASFEKHAAIRQAARESYIQAESSSRLRALAAARSMPVREYREGMLVYYWRARPLRESAGTHKLGGFRGPARVLAVERRDTTSAGSEPRCLWLGHGGRLIRVTPGQIRLATRMGMELQASMSRDPSPPSVHDMSAIEQLLSRENMSQWEDLSGGDHQIPADLFRDGGAKDLAEQEDVPDSRFSHEGDTLGDIVMRGSFGNHNDESQSAQAPEPPSSNAQSSTPSQPGADAAPPPPPSPTATGTSPTVEPRRADLQVDTEGGETDEPAPISPSVAEPEGMPSPTAGSPAPAADVIPEDATPEDAPLPPPPTSPLTSPPRAPTDSRARQRWKSGTLQPPSGVRPPIG